MLPSSTRNASAVSRYPRACPSARVVAGARARPRCCRPPPASSDISGRSIKLCALRATVVRFVPRAIRIVAASRRTGHSLPIGPACGRQWLPAVPLPQPIAAPNDTSLYPVKAVTVANDRCSPGVHSRIITRRRYPMRRYQPARCCRQNRVGRPPVISTTPPPDSKWGHPDHHLLRPQNPIRP